MIVETHTTHIQPCTADGLRIRTARPQEYEHIGRLTYEGFGHAEPGARQPDKARLQLLLDARTRATTGDLLVAESSSGELVGTASLLRPGSALTRQSRGAASRGTMDMNGEAELRLLAVLPCARRSGAGRALMEMAMSRAAAWNVSALVLDTGPENFRSQRLYHRLGFERRPERETLPSSAGPPLAVFRYPFDEPDGTVVRLAGRHHGTDTPGYDEWHFEARSTKEQLATVLTHPLVAPGSGAHGPDVLAPVAHSVTFVPGADSPELRDTIAAHLGMLRRGGLVV